MIQMLDPVGSTITSLSADIFGITLSGAAEAAIITACAGLLVTLFRVLALITTKRRERQRELYGNAYRVAMAWRQMLYRVRTRAPGSEHELLKRFDMLQVKIDYYRGWTASEGRWIGRSYARLVTDVQNKTNPLINKAWKMPYCERLPTNDDRDGEGHPQTNGTSDQFLKDVRNFLSPWLVPKLAVIWRNLDAPDEPR
jgi:hypothetical protein